MEETKNDTITIKKDSLWKYSTFVLVVVVIIGAFYLFSGGNTGTGNVVNNGANNLPGQNARVQVSIDDDAVLGDPNAPVTVIEFTDLQCPFCQRHHQQTYTLIKANYIDTGKVKYVIRDFPLSSIHPLAQKAGEAAECVRDAAKNDEAYFEYVDVVFEKQPQISLSNLKLWAQEQGYNIDSCLDSGKFANEVKKDFADGSAAGVGGTPSVFVNGKMIEGAQPYSVFEQAIEAEL